MLAWVHQDHSKRRGRVPCQRVNGAKKSLDRLGAAAGWLPIANLRRDQAQGKPVEYDRRPLVAPRVVDCGVFPGRRKLATAARLRDPEPLVN